MQALWGGLRLPDNAVACVHVMYGYDCSVAEAVLRMTSSPPLTMASYVFWADIDADHHLVGPNCKITVWLKGATNRMVNNLWKDKVFFLEGRRHPEAGSHDVPRPSYQESDFKLLCPVASGHLPLRQEWLELMEGKYTNDTVKLAFRAFVKSQT